MSKDFYYVKRSFRNHSTGAIKTRSAIGGSPRKIPTQNILRFARTTAAKAASDVRKEAHALNTTGIQFNFIQVYYGPFTIQFDAKIGRRLLSCAAIGSRGRTIFRTFAIVTCGRATTPLGSPKPDVTRRRAFLLVFMAVFRPLDIVLINRASDGRPRYPTCNRSRDISKSCENTARYLSKVDSAGTSGAPNPDPHQDV